MESLNGFVYGHYDSRGGTVMVQARSRKEADRIYLEKVWLAVEGDPSDPEFYDEIKGVCEEDFLYEATLYYDALPVAGSDLEEIGAVLVKGENTKPFDWNEQGPNEFGDPENHGLEYVVRGQQPVKFKDGWSHPRWDDDAYGFYIY
jgi:hypothetical protein